MNQAWRLVSIFFLIAISGCVLHQADLNTFHNALGEEVLWETDSLPITIIIDPGLSLQYRNIVIGEINNWNHIAHGELFSYTFGTRQEALDHSGSSCYLSTRYFDSNSSETGTQILGRVIRYYNTENGVASSITFCDIQIWNQLDPEIWSLVIMHELGHVLGLQHDNRNNSIMYRHVLITLPIVERRDLDWIRSLLRRSEL